MKALLPGVTTTPTANRSAGGAIITDLPLPAYRNDHGSFIDSRLNLPGIQNGRGNLG
jgi:hypothetical protein